MVRENPRDRYQSIEEVLTEFRGFSVGQLHYGRELEPGELPSPICFVNIGRELENALNFLINADQGNILERLAAFEYCLDRLVDAHDHKAQVLSNIHPELARLIEGANRFALFQLVQVFLTASEQTKDKDWYQPDPDNWARFLAGIFSASRVEETKRLCLEGLVSLLARYGSVGTKHHLYKTIESSNEQNYLEYLGDQLRQKGYQDLAFILYQGLDERDFDKEELI